MPMTDSCCGAGSLVPNMKRKTAGSKMCIYARDWGPNLQFIQDDLGSCWTKGSCFENQLTFGSRALLSISEVLISTVCSDDSTRNILLQVQHRCSGLASASL